MTYKEQQQAKQMFRDWMNNFISVSAFAEHYGINEESALAVIEQGREVHNREAEFTKKLKA